MANHILAVHLNAGHVSLAIAESTLRSLRITAIASAPVDAEYLPDYVASRRWDRVVASLPGESAFFRLLEFPFHDRRRLTQAVGPALEEHVPGSLDDSQVVYDFASDKHRSPVLAAMISREVARTQLDALAEAGVRPGRLLWAPSATLECYRRAAGPEASYTVVDLAEEGATVAVVTAGRLEGLRVIARADEEVMLRNIVWSLRTLDPPTDRVILGGPRCVELQTTVGEALGGYAVELLPEDCPVTLTDTTSQWRLATTAVGLILAAAGESASPLIEMPVGSRDGTQLRSEAVSAATRLGPWAAATAALLLLAGGLDYARLQRDAGRLERQAEKIFSAVMPPGAAGPGYRLKMELRVEELLRRQAELAGSGPATTPLTVLAEMSSIVPRDLVVEFDKYAYDPPGVRLQGRGDSFESVTRLQQILEASPRFAGVEVRDVRAAVDGDGVDFELSIRLGSPVSPA